MLEVKNIKSGYEEIPVLQDVSFRVETGQIVAILGGNGVGKTTLLKTVVGRVKPLSGDIIYQGESILNLPTHQLIKKGISMVPEGRLLFGKMTVLENLEMGAFSVRNKALIKERLEEVYDIFPHIRERSNQRVETLSGGEQQMVAIARGMMGGPKLLILDEPSLGLSPKLVCEVFAFIKKINKLGISIIMVEQNAVDTLEIADYAYLISHGEVVMEGAGESLLQEERIKKVYLGID